jgi:hypothetical protein
LRTIQRFLLSCSWHTIVGKPEVRAEQRVVQEG